MAQASASKHTGKGGVYQNLIGGSWIDVDGETFQDINPADKSTVAVFPKASRDLAKKAIDSAYEAQKKWADTPASHRARVLFKAADLLEAEKEDFARTMTIEEGKTLNESRGEIGRVIEVFRFFSGFGYRIYGETVPTEDPQMFLYTVREPIGVVSVITPWNFPVLLPAWKMAPALVCGNAVVFKPASYTPLIGLKLADLLERAGVPKGTLNFLTGSGGVLGDELVRNEKVAGVTFTGSSDVGFGVSHIASSRSTMMRVQLEMGGKNPSVVMEDADLDNAATVIARGAFGVTGQSCSATERVLVHKDVYDAFAKRLADKASKIRIGNGLDDVDMGPLVAEEEKKKVLEYYSVGKQEGAKSLTGGGVPQGAAYERGAFVQPTVFTDVSPDMRITREEIFGPVVALFKFSTFDEMIELANNVEYGLLSNICTKNVAYVQNFVKRIQAGVVRVNRPTTGVEVQVPFGGMKKSGTDTYRECGDQAMDFHTRVKSVYVGY